MRSASDIAWSHSALKSYETCPLRYHAEKVTKEVPFDNDAPALVRGREVHKAMELRVGGGVPLPASLGWLEPYAQKLDALRPAFDKVEVERQLTFTSTLAQTSWFGKQAWFRCAADVLAVNTEHGFAAVFDYKTGKNYGDDGQGRINALAVFLAEPAVNTVQTTFVYVDQKFEEVPRTFQRAAIKEALLPALETLSRIAESFNTETWPAKPGFGCKFCKVARCAHYKGA